MKIKLFAVGLLALLLVGAAGPSFAGRANAAAPSAHVASATASHAAFLDKTRFLAHAGIAFFAIHHEYRRYREGYFNSGAAHRVRNIATAAAVLLLGYHEAAVAYGIAKKSNSKTLHAFASPINALVSGMAAVRGRLTKRQFNASDLTNLNNQTFSINNLGRQNGVGSISDVSVPLPSDS